MEDAIIGKAKGIVSDFLSEEGRESYFIIDMTFNPANKHLVVYVDGDNGVDLAFCSKMNRYMQNIIDEENWLGEKYTLDVSSPGATKPLVNIRQYKKHVGRKLEVKTEADKYEGTLTQVGETNITLHWKARVKEGKKKVNKEFEVEVPFDQIIKAKVKLAF